MIAKAAINVMVFAVHICCNGTANGDVTSARGDGQKKACRHDHPQQLIQTYPCAGCHRAFDKIKVDLIKGSHLNRRGTIQLGRITV
jgi:hypothetical protein